MNVNTSRKQMCFVNKNHHKFNRSILGKLARYLIFVIFLFSAFYNILFAQAKVNAIQSQIDFLLNDNFFKSSQIAIDAFDLTDNHSIINLNEKLLLHPASNLKILTATAALIFGKKNSKFSTTFYRMGNVIDSVLNGNIFVVGSGDPDFIYTELDSLIIEIKKLGIKKITGNLYGDVSLYDSLYWGSGWMWDDAPSSDVPYLTPLIINSSAIKVAINSSKIGEPINFTTIPKADFLHITNKAITTEEDTSDVKITRGWISRNNNIEITGRLFNVAEPDTQEINIYNPDIYFLKLVKQSFNKNRIDFSGIIDTLSLPDSAKKLLSFSHSITDILPNLNKESDNLSAESLLRLLAFQNYGKPATAKNGIKMIDSLISILGFNPNNYRIVDGSGLSHYNLISTELITALLKYLYFEQHDVFNLLYSSFAIAGIDGTLKDRMKGGRVFNNVRAKTGSLSGVSTLSGYVTAKNKNLIAFSIFVQNFVGKADKAKEIQDKICKILSGIN